MFPAYNTPFERSEGRANDRDIMETLSVAPPTGDGLCFVLSTLQIETAIRRGVAGMPIGRLSLVRNAVLGQPIFLFDQDARLLYGPYAAVGPGGNMLDQTSAGGKGQNLAAQLRFTPVVRSFLPLPEGIAGDLLAFESGSGRAGRRVPSARVDSAVIGPLLLLFVLRHHSLLDHE